MSKITARDLHTQWQKDDPDYQAAYDALDDEFSIASAAIGAHAVGRQQRSDSRRSCRSSLPAHARPKPEP